MAANEGLSQLLQQVQVWQTQHVVPVADFTISPFFLDFTHYCLVTITLGGNWDKCVSDIVCEESRAQILLRLLGRCENKVAWEEWLSYRFMFTMAQIYTKTAVETQDSQISTASNVVLILGMGWAWKSEWVGKHFLKHSLGVSGKHFNLTQHL